jgi:hypothetical protein
VAHEEENVNAYRILVVKIAGRITLGRTTRKGKNNNIKMDLKEKT